ncbi:MAG: hypothetical protein WC516_06710 [Patescibacteria group bacterium]
MKIEDTKGNEVDCKIELPGNGFSVGCDIKRSAIKRFFKTRLKVWVSFDNCTKLLSVYVNDNCLFEVRLC